MTNNYGRLGTVHTVAYTDSSAAMSGTISTGIAAVRLLATTDCHVVFGASPTATTSLTPLIANEEYYFGINQGEKVAAIRSATNGTLFVTELSGTK